MKMNRPSTGTPITINRFSSFLYMLFRVTAVIAAIVFLINGNADDLDLRVILASEAVLTAFGAMVMFFSRNNSGVGLLKFINVLKLILMTVVLIGTVALVVQSINEPYEEAVESIVENYIITNTKGLFSIPYIGISQGLLIVFLAFTLTELLHSIGMMTLLSRTRQAFSGNTKCKGLRTSAFFSLLTCVETITLFSLLSWLFPSFIGEASDIALWSSNYLLMSDTANFSAYRTVDWAMLVYVISIVVSLLVEALLAFGLRRRVSEVARHKDASEYVQAPKTRNENYYQVAPVIRDEKEVRSDRYSSHTESKRYSEPTEAPRLIESDASSKYELYDYGIDTESDDISLGFYAGNAPEHSSSAVKPGNEGRSGVADSDDYDAFDDNTDPPLIEVSDAEQSHSPDQYKSATTDSQSRVDPLVIEQEKAPTQPDTGYRSANSKTGEAPPASTGLLCVPAPIPESSIINYGYSEYEII